MQAKAQAPGLAAALAEGLLGDIPFSVPCPVDHWATAQVTLHQRNPAESGELPDGGAIMAAVHQTLTHLNRPDLDAHTLISEAIPPPGILGHASAELSAAIAATAQALGQTLPPETIAQIARSVAPAAGVMLPGLAALDHYGGRVMENLGTPPPMEIVALNFGADGIPAGSAPDFGRDDYCRRWQGQQEQSAEALALLMQGITAANPVLIGQAATLTAAAAAAAYPELAPAWRLPEARNFAREIEAIGVIAGRGLTGILLDATQRRGKSAYLKAAQAFPNTLTISHYRLIAGGIRPT